MKQQNMQLPDEDFIPEGLEFREEYMRSALSMYEGARKTLLWKKWMYGSLGMGVVLVSAILLLHTREVNENNLTSTPAITGQNTTPALTPTTQPKASTFKDDLSDESHGANAEIKHSPITTQSPDNVPQYIVSTTEEKPSITSREDKTSITQNPTNEPFRNAVKHRSEPLPSKSAPGIQITEAPAELVSGSTVHTDPSAYSSPIMLTSENISDNVADRIPAPVTMLTARNGIFHFGEETLRRAGMPIIPISKWTTFVSIGLNPFTRYGLNYAQLHLNPAVSIGMQYSVCSGSALRAGLEYYSITDLSHPFAINNSEYGQGSLKTQTTIYTHTLHYAGIHVQHITPFGKRHAALLGYCGSYLINGQNEISTSSTQNSESLAGSTSKANGYIDGFRQFNHALTFGYEYKIGSNKHLGINYNYGLSDITRDAYFGAGFDRNSMIGVYLKMNIR